MLQSICYVGADFSFRRKDFNRLFCKSTAGVTSTILIATALETVKAKVFAFVDSFRVLTLAPNVA